MIYLSRNKRRLKYTGTKKKLLERQVIYLLRKYSFSKRTRNEWGKNSIDYVTA